MTHADPNQFTLVLQRAQAGDTRAADELATLMYGELKAVAVAMLRRENPAAGGAPLTLQPTALVHEAYVRLLGSAGKSPAYKDRKHFFNAAALAMRHILIDRARSGRVGQRSAALDSIVLGADGSTAGGEPSQHTAASTDEQFLALENALQELAERDARQHEVVMLRYFAGLTIEHTAEVMDLSTATVKSEWTYARAWLLHRMEKDGHAR